MVLPPSLASPAPAASCSPFLSCHPIHFPAGNRLREPVPTGASDPCLRTPRGFSAALSRVGSTEQALRVHLATKARVVQRRGSAVPAARHGARRAPASAVGTRLASFCSPGLPQTPATTTRPWDCALGLSFRAGRGLALPSGYSHHVSSLDPSFAFSGGELRAIEVAAQNPRLPPAHSMGPEACFSQTGPAALVGPQKLPGLAPGVGPVIKWAPDSRLERRETSCHLATLPYPASAGSRPCPAPVVSSPRPHGAARGPDGEAAADRGPSHAWLSWVSSPEGLLMSCTCSGWEGAGEGPKRGLETCVLEEEGGGGRGREGKRGRGGRRRGRLYPQKSWGATPLSLQGWPPGSQAPAEGPGPAVCWVVVVGGRWRYSWRAHASPSGEKAPSLGPAWRRLGATGGRCVGRRVHGLEGAPPQRLRQWDAHQSQPGCPCPSQS